ncbi:hypothetical protein OO010_02210 [Flavobacteriaceae bacterium KMM 6898]|nr:hypothetical protein [Flavobacteriaceae bacterium KMM 6898]
MTTGTDTVVKPKGQWSVTHEYDELGNLIKYDSAYSWSIKWHTKQKKEAVPPFSYEEYQLVGVQSIL